MQRDAAYLKRLATYDAPEGQVWQCGACGKKSKNRAEGPNGWDEACFLKSVLVLEMVGNDGI